MNRHLVINTPGGLFSLIQLGGGLFMDVLLHGSIGQ